MAAAAGGMALNFGKNLLGFGGGNAGKVGGKTDREQAVAPEDVAAATEGKISRSKGAGGLADLIGGHTGERMRFFLLRTQYRPTIVYGEEGLQEAGTSLEAFYRFFDRFNEITAKMQADVYPGQLFYELPVAHVTRRVGRPFTLVLAKQQALFSREAERRAGIERDLAWLGREPRTFV